MGVVQDMGFVVQVDMGFALYVDMGFRCAGWYGFSLCRLV